MWFKMVATLSVIVLTPFVLIMLATWFNPNQSRAAVIAEFYDNVRQQDFNALDAMFVPATTDEGRSIKSRLFTGKDSDGTPGGPTLGQTNSASYRLLSYVVQREKGLMYPVVEKREYQGKTRVVNINLELVSVNGSWKIKGYESNGGDGVYSAFLLE